MNRGSNWPQARAKWSIGNIERWEFGPPTWLKITALAATYLGEIGGIPFPFEVHEADCTIGRWSYAPSDGAIIWRGLWDNVQDSGQWAFAQQPQPDGTMLREFLLVLDGSLGQSDLLFNSDGMHEPGYFYELDPTRSQCTHFYSFDPPWFPILVLGVYPCTYAEIYAEGASSRDCAPVTWEFMP